MSSAGVAVAIGPINGDDPLAPIRVDGSRWSSHSPPGAILLFLAVPGTSPVTLPCFDSDSIASVKLRIQRTKNFVLKKHKLVFDGRELSRDNCLIRDYGLTDGNVVHLVVQLSDLKAITVETTDGKRFEFQVKPSWNVGDVKRRLVKRGVEIDDFDDHKLVFEGEELEDHRMISDISRENTAAIHLLICKSAKVTSQLGADLEVSVVTAANEHAKLQCEGIQSIARPLVEPVVVNHNAKLSPEVLAMIDSASAGLENGYAPVMSVEGSGGAYFMKDSWGHRVAVFKPIDEEPMAVNNPRGLPLSVDGEGLKRGTRVGEGALREVAAYILDYPVSGHDFCDQLGFSGVPPTVMVRCLHDGFNHPGGFDSNAKNLKVGSLQMFVKNIGSCEDMGPQAFPIEEVHKIAVLDIRLANADRHSGNILVCQREDGCHVLVPIDHGYCLPEKFEDCTFEWLYWPQAREPFSVKTLEFIKALNAEEDIALLGYYGWQLQPSCARILRVSTMLLKKGAERGLSPYEIGQMMCRETLKKASAVEQMVCEAEDAVLPGSSEVAFLETLSEIMDCYIKRRL